MPFEPIAKGYRSGFVALVGRPNVGKSTLVNKLVGEKVAITSPIAQTTRNKLRGIISTSNAQLILVDTPGIHKPHHLLGERLVKSACSAIGDVDVVLFLVEGDKPPGKGDAFIAQLLKQKRVPTLIVLNKWDLVSKEQSESREEIYKKLFKETQWPIYKCSAKEGYGCDLLITALSNELPIGPQLYPPEMVCDQPERLIIAELIREQVLKYTREEIPHSVAVNVERIQEVKNNNKSAKGKTINAILATILVEKKSQKGILIGKGGSMLKDIGQGARIQIQNLIDGPVYLELFVKLVPNWRSKPGRLSELGYLGE